MKITITSNTSILGEHVERGTVLEVEKPVANDLFAAGKAKKWESSDDAGHAPPAPEPEIEDVDLSEMTKANIAKWALENLDMEVSPELSKDDMIAAVQAAIDEKLG
tara:strand:+ start:4157 stop:4474 length:318 start_codon:yes stop_codon:yes gene_type:complete